MFHTSIFHFSHTLQKNSMYTSLLSETDTEMSNLLLEINVKYNMEETFQAFCFNQLGK